MTVKELISELNRLSEMQKETMNVYFGKPPKGANLVRKLYSVNNIENNVNWIVLKGDK